MHDGRCDFLDGGMNVSHVRGNLQLDAAVCAAGVVLFRVFRLGRSGIGLRGRVFLVLCAGRGLHKPLAVGSNAEGQPVRRGEIGARAGEGGL